MKRIHWDFLIGFILTALLGWGVWVTNKVFDFRESNRVFASESQNVAKSTEEMKKTLDKIDQKIEDDRKQRIDDQKELNRVLLEIERQIKNNGLKK